MAKNPKSNDVYLISNGDFRDSANRITWPLQEQTIKLVAGVCKKLGLNPKILPGYDAKRKHGFITRQSEAAAMFSQIDPDARVIVVLSCWVYAHHMAGPLGTHKGPILLLANFDGTNPGLVAMLNHTASLDRCCIRHSRLWTESFLSDPAFMKRLETWVKTGSIEYSNPTSPTPPSSSSTPRRRNSAKNWPPTSSATSAS